MLVGGVGDQSCNDVTLEEVVCSLFCFEHNVAWGQFGCRFGVNAYFVVETTLELGALPGQLLGVERHILTAGSVGRYGHEVFHPSGAAHLTAAGTYTAYASGFLTGSDLFHLNADAEYLCQHLDELAEIDALVGNVVEDGLVAVALIFHVAYLHVQSEVLGNLARLDHGVVLAGFGFLVLQHVGLLG